VTVKREAILHDGAAAFVYVPGEEGSFERAPVKTGRSDGVRIEILEGLDAGASYVAGNAFLLKAEAGKNAAAHSH
jgi:cobalt-zinc-cadmium efflux system membrane fusion protein